MVDWCTMSGCDTRISWYSSVGTLYRFRCCDVSRMGTAITYKIDLAIIWTRGSLLRIGKSTKQIECRGKCGRTSQESRCYHTYQRSIRMDEGALLADMF